MNTIADKRLRREYLMMKTDPVPFIIAEPLPNNIRKWHYVLRGPPDTPYKDGIYHGKLTFPKQFPFKPPSIYMITPNGRFDLNKALCLSISNFHPETWQPCWTIPGILTAFLSFMLDDEVAVGTIKSSDCEKLVLAKKSLQFNLKNKIFCELFPEIVTEINEKLKSRSSEAEKSTDNLNLQ